jgi:hypothetical protein
MDIRQAEQCERERGEDREREEACPIGLEQRDGLVHQDADPTRPRSTAKAVTDLGHQPAKYRRKPRPVTRPQRSVAEPTVKSPTRRRAGSESSSVSGRPDSIRSERQVAQKLRPCNRVVQASQTTCLHRTQTPIPGTP